MPREIEIRACQSVEEFWKCVDLERQVWGVADVDLVPSTIFVVMQHTGGQIFGAFDPERGGKMVGFVLACPAMHLSASLGTSGTKAYLHSHMTAVLPEYQNRGIGRRLKLFQREEALARGIELVEWTFDPLEIRNAYLNLERLGAVVRRYNVDFYGQTSSPLHANLPTDRLVAEWWLRSKRVEAAIGGRKPQETAQATILVPANIAELRKSSPEEAGKMLADIRGEFRSWFARGYVATGMKVSAEGGAYQLVPGDAGTIA